MAIQWDKSLSVGVKLVDEQHQELFRMVNDLVEAMRRNQGRDELGRMLSFLATYVVEHFGTEEKLMARCQYPGTATHKRQHTEFVRKVVEVKAAFDASGPTTLLSIAVNQFVLTWLREHIGRSDMELGRFLLSSDAPEARR